MIMKRHWEKYTQIIKKCQILRHLECVKDFRLGIVNWIPKSCYVRVAKDFLLTRNNWWLFEQWIVSDIYFSIEINGHIVWFGLNERQWWSSTSFPIIVKVSFLPFLLMLLSSAILRWIMKIESLKPNGSDCNYSMLSLILNHNDSLFSFKINYKILCSFCYISKSNFFYA